MTFESEGLLVVAIYIWLPPASYVVFSDNSGYAYRMATHAHTATEWYKSGDSAIMKQGDCLIIEGRMSDPIIKT